MATQKLKRSAVVEKLRTTEGNITLAARLLGVSRYALYNFIEKHKLGQLLEDSRAAIVDHAESGLRRAVLNGAPWAIALTLRTLGRSRGYVERVESEVTGKNGGAIEVVHVFDHGAAVAAASAGSGEDSAESGAH